MPNDKIDSAYTATLHPFNHGYKATVQHITQVTWEMDNKPDPEAWPEIVGLQVERLKKLAASKATDWAKAELTQIFTELKAAGINTLANKLLKIAQSL